MESDQSDDIRYVKLILLLVKGGTFLTKKIVSSLGQKYINDILKDNEDLLENAKNISEKQMKILFPGQSTSTDLECWDISLYSYILLNLFGDKFNCGEKAAIEALRETRNKLAHPTSTTVPKVEFLREWERLTMALCQLKRRLAPDDQDEYNGIVDQIYTITDFLVATNELKPFEESDELVHEVLKEKLKSFENGISMVEVQKEQFDVDKLEPENTDLVDDDVDKIKPENTDLVDDDVDKIKPENTDLVDGDVDRIRRENIDLLDEISSLCHRQDRKDVENILLLGRGGAGKSALVNTVMKVIAGQYIPKATIGKGIAASKTLGLTRFENCGLSWEDIVHGPQHDLVKKLIDKKLLPTLIDVAAKGEENSPRMLELLELLIGGFVPPGTSIKALEKLQDEYGVGELRDTIYTTSNPVWKVHKVVFVQGCHDALPINLIECLQSVLRITDPTTGVHKYTQDVYVVITKFDLVFESPEFKCGTGDYIMTMEEFKGKEADIAEQFNITGALAYNRIRWVNYNDNVGYDNPHIDNIALKFLKRMVTPRVVQPEPVRPVLSPTVRLKLFVKRLMRDTQMSWSFVLMMILIVAIAIVIGMMLSKPV